MNDEAMKYEERNCSELEKMYFCGVKRINVSSL